MKIVTTSCGTATIRVGQSGEHEVLLVRPRAYQEVWGTPKGHLNPDEEHMDCAARETLEETGIDVHVLTERFDPVEVNSGAERKTVHIFLAYPVAGMKDLIATEPHPADGENYQVAWFPVSKLPACHQYQRPLFDALPNAVRRVFTEK